MRGTHRSGSWTSSRGCSGPPEFREAEWEGLSCYPVGCFSCTFGPRVWVLSCHISAKEVTEGLQPAEVKRRSRLSSFPWKVCLPEMCWFTFRRKQWEIAWNAKNCLDTGHQSLWHVKTVTVLCKITSASSSRKSQGWCEGRTLETLKRVWEEAQ